MEEDAGRVLNQGIMCGCAWCDTGSSSVSCASRDFCQLVTARNVLSASCGGAAAAPPTAMPSAKGSGKSKKGKKRKRKKEGKRKRKGGKGGKRLSNDGSDDEVAQRGGGGPIPGNIQGQAGRGSEQLDLVGHVSAYCSGVGLDDL
ncbi:hypothetical protein llap_7646 [Limosa lapponica baueri]|uniref:Uncharacterized protein n=1 Tax=Limosa lapponica baueri TaxID=1758121 RepID=A0A2I0U7K4_LIMLA|nr:hypothetical protein llap_7646 [Limosa lapponica baueri]